ncbi:MAG: CopD family protein [Cyclobacteriaceae bacterium]|nr:CopD family protein [Cyclobacteriaceae bacterium]MCH8515553.1 CopD family protein [Cyclobacteriaceae bacterium]
MISLYIKALHLIFVVTWFAGMFYIVRFFIYQTEAQEKDEQVIIPYVKLWSKRLWYGITWPSAIVTLILGLSALYQKPYLLQMGYFHIKIAFLIGIYAYQLYNHRLFLRLQNDIYDHGSTFLRFWNEVATIFLVAIVFLIVVKDSMSLVYGVLGLFVFILVLMTAIKIYKNIRLKSENKS